MANSVDPNQTLHSVASDMGLYKGFSVPILRVNTVFIIKALLTSNHPTEYIFVVDIRKLFM